MQTKEAAPDVKLGGNQSAEVGASIKNWLGEQDNLRFKPTLNLRKVERNFPNLENQLEKLHQRNKK